MEMYYSHYIINVMAVNSMIMNFMIITNSIYIDTKCMYQRKHKYGYKTN